MTGWRQARNILVVRLDNIGDAIMLSPALRAIKECSPEARLTLLASPAGSLAAPLLPWIDEVITWRAVWQDIGGRVPFDPERELGLVAELRRRRFDAALIFTSFSQTPHVPGYLCYLAGIPLRAGESKEFGGGTLTTELQGAPDLMQQTERSLRLIESLGFTVRDRRLAVEISTGARSTAGRLLGELGLDATDQFILLHPGASAQARRIPAELSREIATLLGERGWTVLVTGVEREAELVEFVAGDSPSVHPLVGKTTLAEYAALVDRAALVICGNTLPLHLADAVQTPVVCLFSGTDHEEQWRPRFTPSRLLRRPTDCHPCYRFDCPIGQPCLDIPAGEVVDAVEELLGSKIGALRRRYERYAENNLTTSPSSRAKVGEAVRSRGTSRSTAKRSLCYGSVDPSTPSLRDSARDDGGEVGRSARNDGISKRQLHRKPSVQENDDD